MQFTMKISRIALFLLILLALGGCQNAVELEGQNYSIESDPEDENLKWVTLQTYDPASQAFTFRFDARVWTIEEWPEQEAVNEVVLIHEAYDDGSCYLLPGTLGKGLEAGNLVYEGSLLTENYTARSLEVKSAAGIRILYAVGYEVEGLPYIFEVNFPPKDQEPCEEDAQQVINSFKIVGDEEAPLSSAIGA